VNIAIIGAGRVGAALGTRWAVAGHAVMYGVRKPDDPKMVPLLEGTPNGRAGSVAQAAAFGDVVVLATPWSATESAIRAAGNLAGKVVVDVTNPLNETFSGLTVGHTRSGGEMVAGWAKGAKVVKTLNSTGSNNMLDPKYGKDAVSMFVCGDDAAAKATVSELVKVLGFDVVDAGPLASARLLEPLAMLWISLAYAWGQGTDIAFRLMRR
jgi:8-hydroxy-5-deazaflavin:NADPH oxidoreductase